MAVSYKKTTAAEEIVDSWDYWPFSINMNTNLNGEKSYDFLHLFGGLSAARVTEEWKLCFSLNANYNESVFRYEATTDAGIKTIEIKSFSRGQSLNALAVKSINDHWSVGGFVSTFTSTFSNIKLNWNMAPAIEYNLFPYSQSTREQLRFLYRIGLNNVRYYEETIFDKTSEVL